MPNRLLVSLAILLAAGTASAQDAPVTPPAPPSTSWGLWRTSGVGSADGRSASIAGATYRHGEHLVSVHFVQAFDFDLNRDAQAGDYISVALLGSAGDRATNGLGTGSVQYGRVLYDNQTVLLTAAAGPSLVFDSLSAKVGGTAVVEVSVRPLRWLGVGAQGVASINGAQSFSGTLATLHLGRLR